MQILGLRLADGEKIPSLGFIYGELLVAKNSIKETTDHLEKNYQPIFKIIDEKMKGWLDSPLHMAAYFLNPFYFYKDPNIQCDLEVIDGSITCVETFYHGDFEKQGLVVNHEVNLYKNRNGSFGRNLAMTGWNWWSTYGCGTPHLQKLAKRILAWTSSSSGCERNWSSFEAIHKKRLDVNRLNSLVYVQLNARLFNKHQKIRENNVDVIFDDGNEDTVGDWLVEHVEEMDSDVNFVLTTQAPRVRDLYDDDFESEDEDIVDMKFESDVFQEDPIFHDSQPLQ
ncbi:PREDICTED: uncharacterized protein LOC106338842 [Brassica oleracea var. oleracea]|uniref:uncharacterized protein LOC106338842 n=1 Tax=Brassica oleracea var. oleracea TaxID=109376 RepID=UPI0006A6FC37|nr:PREDICTED: uncharacterized protein LOC106338842 [Brassica oleracea var. oleracea]